jgi:hypothetical protein
MGDDPAQAEELLRGSEAIQIIVREKRLSVVE